MNKTFLKCTTAAISLAMLLGPASVIADKTVVADADHAYALAQGLNARVYVEISYSSHSETPGQKAIPHGTTGYISSAIFTDPNEDFQSSLARAWVDGEETEEEFYRKQTR